MRKPRKPRARSLVKIDLNESAIPNWGGRQVGEPGTKVGGVEVSFRDLKDRLIFLIEQSDYMVGCVAWLTDADILNALAKLKGAAIVVQKEDFLRPDASSTENWRARLRDQYEAIRPLKRSDFRGILDLMSRGADPTIGVRCVGNNNRDRVPAFPRSHHKFGVFFRNKTSSEQPESIRLFPDGLPVEPVCVWTGSFNWTRNAGQSFENAVQIYHPPIADAFVWEFQQIAALSEPLDWENDWMAPEWRIVE